MPAEMPSRLMAVLVVYERNLDAADAWPTLCAWLADVNERRAQLKLERVLIYDNSRQPRARPPAGMPGCEYIHNPDNGGTAAAYAAAVGIASALGIEWLLLLDHDTQLPATFLEQSSVAASAAGQPAPVALVPWVRHGRNTIVSPTEITFSGSVRPLRRGHRRSRNIHLSAIASGSVLSVATLRSLPPMPKGLWLDYVDHWIFAQLHRSGLRTAISDQVLQHDLAFASRATLSPARLVSVLDGEAIFVRLLGLRARIVHPLRLACRILILARANPRLAMTAIRWILRRRPADR